MLSAYLVKHICRTGREGGGTTGEERGGGTFSRTVGKAACILGRVERECALIYSTEQAFEKKAVSVCAPGICHLVNATMKVFKDEEDSVNFMWVWRVCV